ncbi:MAG: universal stress protein [Candidatus Promineifilaceae bacterium]
MSEEENTLAIRRILVALDASTHSLAALKAAAELAAGLKAELMGLYVEDENLVHLAGLPFATEVRSLSADSRSVNSNEMEVALRLQASQARRAMEAAAVESGAKWSFQVVRGQVTATILKAALEADLLAMGRVGRPISSRSRLGSSARAAMTRAGRSVLLVKQGRHLHHPILVTFDGSAASRQALTAAAQLAQTAGDTLNVLLLDGIDKKDVLQQAAAAMLEPMGVEAVYRQMAEASVAELVRQIKTAESCVLVLGGDNPLLEAENIQELLDETDCPVMLVR